MVNGEKSAQNPEFSPNGKELAYTDGFNTLKIITIANNQSRTLITQKEWLSWGDGGHRVSWSPDSKWLLVNFSEQGIGNSEIGLLSADGKTKMTNLTMNGFDDGNAKWMMGGKMMLWFSNRDGLASKANSGNAQTDAYGMFFTQDGWDSYRLSKEEAALAKEQKEKAEKADTTKKAAAKKDSVVIDWAGLDRSENNSCSSKTGVGQGFCTTRVGTWDNR